ncbi:PrgI family protein [Candidatus Collierbacteria bacterium]|nr:PrgI family protein [Candidatus Collierbacteria bacterium]
MPIEQHPIPQDVAGYKFRLIGEMTVKQFIWLASGIILGLVAYSLPLPFFFKYPLTGLFVALGAGIAFLPIEGRPMDKWLIAFIKSVYSPTQYIWKKGATETGTRSTAVLSPESHSGKIPVVAPKPVTVQAPPTAVPPKPVIVPVVPQTTPAPIPQSKPEGNLPVPFTPTTPNTLVGMTLTPEGKILDGCLIEIKANGISLRATKSNQLGQFLFAKPLENGQYQILTEKLGYLFDNYSLSLTSQIVKPLRLQAKNHVEH